MGLYDETRDLRQVVAGDNEIKTLLAIPAGGKISDYIQDKMVPEGLASNRRVLTFYPVPGVKQKNYLTYRRIYEFDVHVPAVNREVARQILDRVHELLCEQTIADKYNMQYEGDLGELATAANYYCLGVRYSFLILH